VFSPCQVWNILPCGEIKNNKIREKENTFNIAFGMKEKTETSMHGIGRIRIH
jgi:hypothetical protein